MKAATLLTPLLVLGLLLIMPRLEVWAQRPTVPVRRPRRKAHTMTSPASHTGAEPPEAPLLRDPPPPPGYVEPLAGSSAEDTSPSTAGTGAGGA